MKILLVGEFSGVHSNVQRQLIKEGHCCDLLSDGDGWKGFSSNILLPKREKLSGWYKIFFPLLDFFGLAGIGYYFKCRNKIKNIGSYDVVQFINPMSIKALGALGNVLLFKNIKKNNSSVFLCALGGDLNVELFYISGKLKYSPWSAMGFKNIIHYYQNISFFFPAHIFLHYYVLRNVKKIIPGLYEYKEAYKNNKKCTDLVPLPVDVLKPDAFKKEVKDGVVRIFFGKKPYLGDFYKKGYGYFDDALIKLKKEGEKFELVTASGVPFNEYIQLLQSCHILLDQSLSYDRGMSGVIGMANGMVTFSGNEQEIQTYWPEPVPCINALPDPDFIYSKLKYFLNNPDTLRILGEDSYNFVMKYHSLTVVTKKYLKIWCEE